MITLPFPPIDYMLQLTVPPLLTMLAFVLVNFLTGVLAALRTHTFDAEKLPEFLIKDGSYVLYWLLFRILVFFVPQEYMPDEIVTAVTTTFVGIAGLVCWAMLKSIIENGAQILPPKTE